MRRVLLASIAVLSAGPVLAHDLWLQPRSFHQPAPGPVATSIQIGHGDDRETWAVRPERIVRFTVNGPSGTMDVRPLVRAGAGDQRLPASAPGLHVFAYQSNAITSTLPAVRFNAYLLEEGLTPALQARERAGQSQVGGRELYSRRAKTLVQVGPVAAGDDGRATAPLGLTLEIVPERNPYALRPGEPVPVRVLYEGRPLPGALVKLTDLNSDAKPLQTLRTDAKGRAVFTPGRAGAWLLNVVWTKPLSGDPRADWETVFSSLTFGHREPGGARR